MLVALTLGDPALGRGGLVGVVLDVVAHVGEAFLGAQFALRQGAEAGDHLEDGAGGGAGADGVVEHQVAVVGQDGAGLLAAGHQGVQVVGGEVGHRQDIVLHVQHHHHAVLRQGQGILLPVALGDVGAVFLQPAGVVHEGLLLVADLLDIVGDGALGLLLVGGADGQLDVVAVLGLSVGQLAHDGGEVVALHDAAALGAVGGGGQPGFHRIFDAVASDDVIVGVALGLQLQPLGAAGDLAHVADDLGGQGVLGVDALGGDLHAHAGQRHGAGFHLDDALVGHVLGDRDGQGVEQVHLHLGVDGHDLEHHVLLQDDEGALDAVSGLDFLEGGDLLLALGDAVLALEALQAVLRRGEGTGSDVVVGAPLLFAGLQDAVRHAGAEVEDPFAGRLVPLDDIIEGQGAAVALDDADGFYDGLSVLQIIGLGDVGAVLVEGDVVHQLVLGQDNGVRVGDVAALAAKDDLLLAHGLRLVLVFLAVHQLQFDQAAGQVAEHQQQNADEREVSPADPFLRIVLRCVAHK